MRHLRLLPFILGAAAAFALRAADAPKVASQTDVVFDHPENFTDVKDGSIPTDRGRDAILSKIREFLVARSALKLPEGYKLRITFTDIDLAGDFEPWRGHGEWADVRIIKPIYPPAFKFTYAVADPSGKVVKEGSENIRDLNFQLRAVSTDDDDPLRYEKDILSEWLNATLRNLAKA
jgi:hypothetical protein